MQDYNSSSLMEVEIFGVKSVGVWLYSYVGLAAH